MRLGLWLLLVGCLPALASAAELRLAEPLSVSKENGVTTLRLALAEPADVEVAVLNAEGKVVRHLAAGVLGGEQPPPAPFQVGLAQQLAWDGKDDVGQPAKNGPFRFRARAGMRVKFGRMIGGDPTTGSIETMPYRAPVNGLVVDEQGNLYVKMMSSVGSHGNSGMWPWHVRKFDRAGNYLATLLPYAPSTPRDKAHGMELLPTTAGPFAPANQNSLYPVFSVLGNEIVSRLHQGQLLFVQTEARQLNFLALDGSNRLKSRPMWSAAAKLNCPSWLDIQVALSPDGRYAYYSNVAGVPYDGKSPADIDPNWPQGRIYRQDLTDSETDPARFFDISLPDFATHRYWMPSAWDKKSAAAGIDTDGAGNVIVCDLVGGKVLRISPLGKQLTAAAVPWPDRVMAARKGNALYVISREVSRGHLPAARLLKIAGEGNQAKVVAELPLTGTVGGAYTLDETGSAPVIWLAGQDEGITRLIRVEDRQDELVVTGDDFLNSDPNAIAFVGYMDVDREAELVYVTGNKGNVWRYNGKTGEGRLLEIKAADVAVGPAGQLYAWGVSNSFQGPIARYSRELEPLPLPSSKSHTYGHLYGRAGRGVSVGGLDVDPLGRVFATYGSNECHIRAYDGAGELVDFDRKITLKTPRGPEEIPVAVAGVVGYGGSIRLDNQGNLYVLQQGLPKDHQPPAGYENDEAYRQAVGTIYKFNPAGGKVERESWTVVGATGAERSYPDCGPISRWRCAGACACTKPRFDVDDYGRLYIPNGITYKVSVRDNAGNEIVRFGDYGNFDCQGPASREPSPAIPLGWAVTAGASDDHIYVGDCLNHRVVRVDKSFALESEVAVP